MNSHKCEYCSTVVEHSKKECYKCGAPNTKYNLSSQERIIIYDYSSISNAYRKAKRVTDGTGPR